jgi:hypothetical protein
MATSWKLGKEDSQMGFVPPLVLGVYQFFQFNKLEHFLPERIDVNSPSKDQWQCTTYLFTAELIQIEQKKTILVSIGLTRTVSHEWLSTSSS